MKSLFAIGAIICACLNTIEQGYAQTRCYIEPMTNYTVCENPGHVRPWIYQAPQRQSQRGLTIYAPRDNSVRKHDPSECTIATGCIPDRGRLE